MQQSAANTASRTVVRYLLTGVAATICTVAAMGSWVSLAFAGPGVPMSSARQRRGRA
jgi:hypothetical protein